MKTSSQPSQLTQPVGCIIGAGYVGLVAACCLANAGHRVTCVKGDKVRLKLLNQGLSPIREKGVDRLIKQGISSGKLTFVPSLPKLLQADIIINRGHLVQ